MSNGIFRVALVAAVLSLITASAVLAADAPAEPKKVTVMGKVTVIKDDAGVVTAVMVTAKDAAYSVTMDDNGKKLAEMAGKEVEVTGTVTEKDGMKWITVESFKEVVKPAPAPAPAK
jgi:DNA/RNA endonuclease YhcR with UshA esterase domain